jgi:ribose transport system substrate-binding protein
VLVAALLLVVSACGAEEESPTTTAASATTVAEETTTTGGAEETTTTAAEEVPEYLVEAQAVVEQAMQPPAFDDLKPAEAAPPFAPGLRIAILIATARSTGAQIQAGGVRQAATAVGWQTTEFDGAGTNEGRLEAFRTILTQDFDGIVLVATDQRVVGDAMVQAAELGIPVVSTMAGNEPGDDPTQVFADAGMDDLEQGRIVGSWIVADAAANGTPVNALLFLNPVNRTVELRDQGVQEVLAECTDCTVSAAENYTSAEVFQTVPQRAQAVLQSTPEINYVMIDVGAYAVYAVQGIEQLGGDFSDQLKLISFDCVPDEVGRIIEGEIQAACQGAASEYSGWAAIDELNRALNGVAPAGSRVPTQLITIDNYAGVTTPAVGYTGPFDYKSAWREFWAPSLPS